MLFLFAYNCFIQFIAYYTCFTPRPFAISFCGFSGVFYFPCRKIVFLSLFLSKYTGLVFEFVPLVLLYISWFGAFLSFVFFYFNQRSSLPFAPCCTACSRRTSESTFAVPISFSFLSVSYLAIFYWMVSLVSRLLLICVGWYDLGSPFFSFFLFLSPIIYFQFFPYIAFHFFLVYDRNVDSD